LITFVEELNHALHAALQFKRGMREITSEDFARNLELQAQMDTYLVLLLFVAFFRKTQRVSATDRRWLRFHLFARQCPEAFRDANLRGRYLETSKLGRVTPITSILLMAFVASTKSGGFVRSITAQKESEFWR